MADAADIPIVGEYAVSSADIVGERFAISFQDRPFTVDRSGSRLDVYVVDGGSPVGFIRTGSPRSGAVWVEDECIGEYQFDEDNTYHVLEVKQGFKLGTEFALNPLVYLLQFINGGLDGKR